MKKNDIKAVIFDMGGVLYDWKKGWGETAKNLNRNYQDFIDIVFKVAPSAELGNMSLVDFFKKIGKEANLGDRWRKINTDIPYNFPKINESFKLLDELEGRYKLAILTNNPPQILDRWEKVAGYKKYFDLIIDSSEVKLRKPDPKIFQLVCDKLNLNPKNCLFIDDSSQHISAAKKVGLNVIHFTDAKKGVAEVRSILGIS